MKTLRKLLGQVLFVVGLGLFFAIVVPFFELGMGVFSNKKLIAMLVGTFWAGVACWWVASLIAPDEKQKEGITEPVQVADVEPDSKR